MFDILHMVFFGLMNLFGGILICLLFISLGDDKDEWETRKNTNGTVKRKSD